VFLPACGGGGGGGPKAEDDTNDLVVVKFQMIDKDGNPTGGQGTTNAYRNNRILIEFSSTLDPASVSDRTIQIGIPSSGNLFLTIDGKFTVDGHKVIFDPTVTSTGAPQPFGYDAEADYTVTVHGFPSDKTILDIDMKPVREQFQTTFRTTDLYLPDQDQPRILSVTPAADATGIGSAEDVVVEFSEAMKPDSIDLESSFIILNGNTGRVVLGQVLYSADATTVTFRPTFGYGKGPTVVTVTLNINLTDLAGNPISNPRAQTFTTVFDPFAPDEGIIEEFFDDTTNRDGSFTPSGGAAHADWATGVGSAGRLVSVFGATSVTIPRVAQGGSSNWIPMGGASWVSCRWQGWYKPNELGQPGTISGMAWMSGSQVLPNATLQGFQLWLCHNNTATGLQGTSPWTANFNVGSPTTCIPAMVYTIPSNALANNRVEFPTFVNVFGYDGTNNLILDVRKSSISNPNTGQYADHISGFDGNIRRSWSTNVSANNPSGSSSGYTWRLVAHFRTETSMARSVWFDTDTKDPIYLAAIVNPTAQPAGTEVIVTFQGALADEDGNRSVSPADWSSESTDIKDMEGYPFIRFKVVFNANISTGVGPALTEILIPFIDK
jgi:hypothetical protein